MIQGQQFLLKAVLLNVVCDAPARCIVQNFTQFNGFFGCGCCMTKGSSVQTSARGTMLSYPYEITDDNAKMGHSQLRTHSETVKYARDAFLNGKPVHGVKGFTVLTDVSYFDIIKCVTVDYMHCVLLGVQKMLLQLWTDNGNKNEKFYIGDYVGVLDDRMAALTSPNVINRSPRHMKELKHWKASEYRSFLLFHSICCLQDMLPQDYYLHYLLFVESIYLLLQSSISRSDISRAQLLLAKFCAQMDYLYGQRYETYNVHCLLHLTEKVEDLGPLWCQSCFFYEDLNGSLRSLFHGTTKIELQIVSAVSIHQQIPFLVKKVTKRSEVEQLYHRFKNNSKHQNREYISNHMLAVGRQIECHHSQATRRLIEHAHGPVHNVKQFFRFLSNGIMFYSIKYQYVTKRNSYTVEYTVNDLPQFGQIQYFLKTQMQSGTKYLAVIKQFLVVDSTTKLPCHFYEVKENGQTDVVDVISIQQMCYFACLTTSKKCFIGKIPVFIECD
ncbi:uncharacterized protein LOC132723884 [Ruditapes philippinarum]|uniref:uncharacterized protein LOC132723884 n=1 Tax=Ruditapes philippinarum TaxID=129788 RepID=UPI00295B5D9B|nr:uncharacterized protein LOC132723884 [Ruditapes philippinarum]